MSEENATSRVKLKTRKKLRTAVIVSAVSTVLSAILTVSTGVNIPEEIIDTVISSISAGGA